MVDTFDWIPWVRKSDFQIYKCFFIFFRNSALAENPVFSRLSDISTPIKQRIFVGHILALIFLIFRGRGIFFLRLFYGLSITLSHISDEGNNKKKRR